MRFAFPSEGGAVRVITLTVILGTLSSNSWAQLHPSDRDLFEEISRKYGELNERGEFFVDDGGGDLETTHIPDDVPSGYETPASNDIEAPADIEFDFSDEIDDMTGQDSREMNKVEHPFDKKFEDGKYDYFEPNDQSLPDKSPPGDDGSNGIQEPDENFDDTDVEIGPTK